MLKTILIIALAVALAAAVIRCCILELAIRAVRLWIKDKQYPRPTKEEMRPYAEKALKDALKIK